MKTPGVGGPEFEEILKLHTIQIQIDRVVRESGLFKPDVSRPHLAFSVHTLERLARIELDGGGANSLRREMDACADEVRQKCRDSLLEFIGHLKKQLKKERSRLLKITGSRFMARYCPSDVPEDASLDRAIRTCDECSAIISDMQAKPVSADDLHLEYAKIDRLASSVKGKIRKIHDANIETSKNFREALKFYAYSLLAALAVIAFSFSMYDRFWVVEEKAQAQPALSAPESEKTDTLSSDADR